MAQVQDIVTINVGSQRTGTQPFSFDPPSVNATKGSVVTFLFSGNPANHSVAQSTFDKPCEPLKGGFNSGYIYVPPIDDPEEATTTFPRFNITIEDDTQPIWFYCAQQSTTPHCMLGMVGAINAPATGDNYDSFVLVAQAASSVVAPFPALSGINAFATAPPGPLTEGFSGAALPTAAPQSAIPSPSQSAPSASRLQIETLGSAYAGGTYCPSPDSEMRGLLAFFTAALAVGLAVNVAGLLCLFRIWRGRNRRNTASTARKISPFV